MSNTVINTNVMALTSHRNLTAVGTKQATANARLSSGKKINTAADDAAGLAISEKMKSQIVGLDMASKNSEDATSLIQTAEGALGEVNNMLVRVRELTVQAANDTNQDSDRVKLAEEAAALMSEIDSISDRTEFNGMTLNDGSFEGYFQIGANGGQSMQLSIGNMTVDGIGASDIKSAFGIVENRLADNEIITSSSAGVRYLEGTTADVTISMSTIAGQITTIAGIGAADGDSSVASGGLNITFNYYHAVDGLQTVSTYVDLTGSNGSATDISDRFVSALMRDTDMGDLFDVSVSAGGDLDIVAKSGLITFAGSQSIDGTPGALKITSVSPPITGDAGTTNAATEAILPTTSTTAMTGKTNNVASDEVTPQTITAGIIVVDPSKMSDGETVTINGSTFTFQKTGGDPDKNTFSNLTDLITCAKDAGITLNADGSITGAKYLVGNGTYSCDSSLISSNGFDYSQTLETIDYALSNVTSQRAALGAAQNRLEYTKNNLDLASENLSAANSRIEDADMAKEMMNLTSANVLQQAATSMLAQANQAPQSVTQLLG